MCLLVEKQENPQLAATLTSDHVISGRVRLLKDQVRKKFDKIRFER